MIPTTQWVWTWGKKISSKSNILDDDDLPQPQIHLEFGKSRQAMMSNTEILSARENIHEVYDVSLLLLDGNLQMNQRHLANGAPINVDIITAGNGDLTGSDLGSLSTRVMYSKGNLHQFWRERMYSEGVNQNHGSPDPPLI